MGNYIESIENLEGNINLVEINLENNKILSLRGLPLLFHLRLLLLNSNLINEESEI